MSDSNSPTASLRVALYVPTLVGGGVERSMLELAKSLAETGYAVDLVVNRRIGAYAERIPENVRLIVLERGSKTAARWTVWRHHPEDRAWLLRPVLLATTPIMSLRYLRSLARYMARERPTVLISAMFYANLLALWARRIARVEPAVIVTEHNTLSRRIANGMKKIGERARWRYLAPLVGRAYDRADAIVAVSDGVACDLASITGLKRARIATIHNPVVSPSLADLAATECRHDWFAPGEPPVVLAVGRLEPQKNFIGLLDAFARLRRRCPVRLMILGQGSQRETLRRHAKHLGLNDDVAWLGWVDNPYAYMSRARVLTMSSLWEGLGNVLIEAMACGCSIVATDCPSGPREILDDGRYGRLVPLNDTAALADAIADSLTHPFDAELLRRRAADFTIERCAARYRDLIGSLVNETRTAESDIVRAGTRPIGRDTARRPSGSVHWLNTSGRASNR